MRTAIFIGLIAISFAINPELENNKNLVTLYSVLAGILAGMDVVEFIKKLLK